MLNFVKLGGLRLSAVTISWVEIFHVGIILGRNFPDGNCLGGSYPGLEFSGWELSQVGIFFVASFVGGNCPVGIIRVAIFRVVVFMLPLLVVLKDKIKIKQNVDSKRFILSRFKLRLFVLILFSSYLCQYCYYNLC